MSMGLFAGGAGDPGEEKMICAKCGSTCTRTDPPVCTACFIQGWGRLPEMLLPEPEAPLYVSDKPAKPQKAKPKKKGRR